MTDPSNFAIIQTLYEAFAARDRDRILEIFDPEIEWIQNEGFPGGGRHVGAETVLNDVFAKFRVDWEAWQAVVERWLDAGEAIVALGEYRGTHKATGRSMKAAFAHVYWVRADRPFRAVRGHVESRRGYASESGEVSVISGSRTVMSKPSWRRRL